MFHQTNNGINRRTRPPWFMTDCLPRAPTPKFVFLGRTLHCKNIYKDNRSSLSTHLSPRETQSPALWLSLRTISASARPLTSSRTTLPMEIPLPCSKSMLSPLSTDRKGTRSSTSTRSRSYPWKDSKRF